MRGVSHRIILMRIINVNSATELSSQTEALFHSLLQKKQSAIRGFLPAGKSAEGFYQALITDQKRWTQQIQFLQIDEFQGVDNFFLKTLQSQILEPLELLPQAEIIQASWTENEFQAHIKKVLLHSIDFALLGLGPNGHIGFHEPSSENKSFDQKTDPFAQSSGADYLGGLTMLTEESFRRVKKAPSKMAFTFGAGSFLKAKEIILLVTGEGKNEIYQKFLATEPTGTLPATLLKSHPNFTVISSI